MKKVVYAFVAAACVAGIQNANAVIIGGSVTTGTGSFVELTPPLAGSTPVNTVGNNTFQNPNLYAFNEDQNVAVAVGGLVPEIGAALTEGTIVAAHYVFFDPKGSRSQIGYVDFDADILAVFTSTGSLASSDYLANTGVTYLNPGLRGLEGGDFVGIDATLGNRLNVRWTASTPGDYVRVLTARSPGANVPDGGVTAGLLGLGLVALGYGARRKK